MIFTPFGAIQKRLCGWTKFFISAALTDEKFLMVANPG